MIYQGPLARASHVVKTDSIHEMMSVPCVQMARVYANEKNNLASNEKDEIKKYIPNVEEYNRLILHSEIDITSFRKYIPNYPTYHRSALGIADSIKNTFNIVAFKENPKKFIHLYFVFGKKYPGLYLDAWARLSIGNWYLDMNYPDPAAYHPYWEYDLTAANASWPYHNNKAILLRRKVPCFLNNISKGLRIILKYNIFQKIPIISQVYSGALTV